MLNLKNKIIMTTTQESRENAKEKLRWRKNIHVQNYICILLCLFLLINSKEFRWLNFSTSFNIIVNSILLLSICINLYFCFIWKPHRTKIFLYAKYLTELAKKEQTRKVSRLGYELDKQKNTLEEFNE